MIELQRSQVYGYFVTLNISPIIIIITGGFMPS
jgi:hypothetical protein